MDQLDSGVWVGQFACGERVRRGAATAHQPGAVVQDVVRDDSEGFSGRVPVFPVVRVALRNAAGRVEGCVEGRVVVLGTLEQAREGVVQAVAVLAADRGGRVAAIRAHGVAFEGAGWDFVVTADGRAFDAPSVHDAAAATQRPGVGRRGRWVLLAPVVIALVFACVAVVGVVRSPGAGVGSGSAGAARGVTPAPVATQLPVAMPAGWSSQAVWSSPVAGSASASPVSVVLAADGHRVYAPGPTVGSGSSGGSGVSVTAYETGTGVVVWSQNLDQPLQAGPALVRVEGRAAVIAATAKRIYTWDPATGAVLGAWPLPSTGGGVLLTATGPVVRRDRAHADVVMGGQLVTRVIPAGAAVVAPGAAGSLVVTAPAAGAGGLGGAGAGRVWSVGSPLVAPGPAVLDAPAGTTYLRTAGWTADALVAAFHTTRPTAGTRTGTDAVVLRAFTVDAAGQWRTRWTTPPIPLPATLDSSAGLGSAGSGWVTSPSGSWAVYGSTVIRLDTGAVVALPADWHGAGLGADFGFGTTGGVVAVVTPAGIRSDPEPGAATTSAATAGPSVGLSIGVRAGGAGEGGVAVSAPGAVSGGTAFLVASDGTATHLYAVTAVAAGAGGGR